MIFIPGQEAKYLFVQLSFSLCQVFLTKVAYSDITSVGCKSWGTMLANTAGLFHVIVCFKTVNPISVDIFLLFYSNISFYKVAVNLPYVLKLSAQPYFYATLTRLIITKQL